MIHDRDIPAFGRLIKPFLPVHDSKAFYPINLSFCLKISPPSYNCLITDCPFLGLMNDAPYLGWRSVSAVDCEFTVFTFHVLPHETSI